MCVSGCARKDKTPGADFAFGYILADKHSKVIHDFSVENTTPERVKIESVSSSCTCTSYKLGKYQLAPGETTTLTMEVDVNNTYMKKAATCVLKTDHPRFQDWSYTIQFRSLPFVVAEPSELQVGSFMVDSENLNSIQNVSLDLFADSKIELTADNFEVPEEINLSISTRPEVRKLQREVWNTRYQITIGLSPKGRDAVSRGSHSGLITKTIQLVADESKSRHWGYSVYWETRPSIESHPSYVSFGNLLEQGEDRSRSIVISSTTNEGFRIVAIRSQPRDIQIEAVDEGGGETPRHRVRLKFTGSNDVGRRPTFGPRYFSGTIEVRTTDKRRPVVEIPWSAMMDSPIKPRSPSDQAKSSSMPGL